MAIPLLRKIGLGACISYFGMIGTMQAYASVVIGGTRVVFAAPASETTVKLTNPGSLPGLVQAWIDVGDPQASPDTIQTPFTVTPPVSRVDPGKAQTLRIFRFENNMPGDRESVYWLNVLEVPPKPDVADETSRMQLAFRTRIKLFYRPEGLKGSPQDAPGQVIWQLVKENAQLQLEGFNPTPFHVSYSQVQLGSGDKAPRTGSGDMIGPGQRKRFPLVGGMAAEAAPQVHWQAINDQGGDIDGTSPFSRTAPTP